MSVSTRSNFKKAASRRWVITAATLVMLAMFPVAYIFYKKTQDIKADLKKYTDPLEQMEQEGADPLPSILTEGFVVKQLSIMLPNQSKAATIKVYWQSDDIFLQIDSLSKLPANEKYELWSIAGGKRTSLGLFDAPETGALTIKAEKAGMTDNYDITVVKEGSTAEENGN